MSFAGAEFQYAEKSLQDQPGGPVPLDKGQFLTLTVPLLHLPGTFLPFCMPPGYPPLEEAASRNPYPAWQKWNATSLSRRPLFQKQGAWDSYKSAVNLDCARTIHNHADERAFYHYGPSIPEKLSLGDDKLERKLASSFSKEFFCLE